VEGLEDRSVPAVFTVTTTTDSGAGSLRQAIIDANATAGADAINFALPDSLKSPGGWWTIAPQTLLPALTDSVMVDGWSQAGAGLGLAPRVMLDGSNTGSAVSTTGLSVFADACTIRGLAIGNFRFHTGWAIYLSGSEGTTIQGCYIGIDPTGTTAASNNQGINDAGVHTMIGGAGLGERNVVSGNFVGITSWGYGVTVQGNFVGTDATGTVAIPNSTGGVGVGGDPPRALPSKIGGLAPGEGNLISGNGENGIGIGTAVHVLVVGNLVGTDVTGTHALGNSPPVFSGGRGALRSTNHPTSLSAVRSRVPGTSSRPTVAAASASNPPTGSSSRATTSGPTCPAPQPSGISGAGSPSGLAAAGSEVRNPGPAT
jgi:hypothetical protein